MCRRLLVQVFFVALLSITVAVDPPSDCRFLNPVHDPVAETALVEFFHVNEPFLFKETNFFQPQCLLCEKLRGEVCFGYKGGSSYGVASGTVNGVRLVTSLSYIYSLGETVGASVTAVDAVGALRDDLVISYRTLSRFKGVATLDPVVIGKTVALRLCMICMPGDTSEHTLTVTGGVDKLNIRLFINRISINSSNGFILDGNKRARINCSTQTVVVESNGALPDESPCSDRPCLGPEFCLTYQPKYATTRETWCPLTEENWTPTANNALKLFSADSSSPLHIRLESILLREKPFSLVLNPNWFIDYAGVLTVSIPEATSDKYPDPVWKIVLPLAGRRPLNQRTILLHDCANVQIRYNVSDGDYFQTTVVFVDMKSNSTFTTKANLDEARKLCNRDILIGVDDGSSSTSTLWVPTGLAQSNTPPFFPGILVLGCILLRVRR